MISLKQQYFSGFEVRKMNILYEKKTNDIEIRSSSMPSPAPHIHKEMEFIFVEKGCTTAIADNKQYIVESGNLFIAFPNQLHFFKNSVSGKFRVIIVNPAIIYGAPAFVKNKIPENNVINLTDNPFLLQTINCLFGENAKTSRTTQCGYINILFGKIMPILSLKSNMNSSNTTIKTVLDYCCHHYFEELTLDSVSDVLHLNKYYISHLINNLLNISFTDYINSLRIYDACTRLRETEEKIADISEDVGFGTIRSFNRSFKELMNLTPYQYRKEYQSSEKR